MLTRRALALGLPLAAMGAAAPFRLAAAKPAATHKRLVFIIQRGAADGLATIIPTSDPALAGERRALLDGLGKPVPVGSDFALHPALSNIGALSVAGQALFVHGVGLGYRDRSHFDAQNVLETGGLQPYATKDGWLNRLIGLVGRDVGALAYAPTVPAVLRGPQPVTSYAPSKLPAADADLVSRLSRLYAADEELHRLFDSAQATRALAGAGDGRSAAAATGASIARLMTPANSARIVTIESDGWDTHNNQKARLARQLAELDALVGGLKDGLGAVWADTLVIVATEFGRTVKLNGTGGTDHGTASAAMLIGGRVAGGRVLADWPGLGASQLYEARDLRPTLSLESVLAGAVAGQFALDPALVARTLYPAHGGLKPQQGLLRL